MGISVKSRSRRLGREKAYLHIPNKDLKKAQEACDAFGCVPYIAVVVDTAELIRVFITPMDHLVELFPPTAASVGWKMTDKHLERYDDDPQVMIFELSTATKRWWRQV